MKSPQWIGVALLVLTLTGQGLGRQQDGAVTPRPGFWQWLAPTGGWHPYGGGLLHWWNPFCFPRLGGPDDYCRKPLPNVCFPAYPPYYIWGPPANCPPPYTCPPNGRKMP
jgi:hypothetical protein